MSKTLMKMSLLIAVLIAAPGKSAPAQAMLTPMNDKPLTVCEVLKNRQAYSGKIIKVRDEFYGWMAGKDCAPLLSGGQTWPSMIEVAMPCKSAGGLVLEFLCGIAEWRGDERAFQKAIDDAWRLMAPERPVVVEHIIYTTSKRPAYATVVGRLDTRPLDRDGSGFGDQGALPVRLVLVSVSEVSRRR